MEAYKIKHKSTRLYYEKYTTIRDYSCLVKTIKDKGTQYKA